MDVLLPPLACAMFVAIGLSLWLIFRKDGKTLGCTHGAPNARPCTECLWDNANGV